MNNDNDTKSGWMRNYWRPMMAVVYMVIVLFDFLIAPILWSLFQYYAGGDVSSAWSPITLISGGLFHVAMGGVLGVSALTRGQEKIQQIKQSNKYNHKANVEVRRPTENDSPVDEEEFDFEM